VKIYTLFRNFYVFGKVGYFYYGLSDNLKFNNWSFDINLNYYFYKFLGIGATYEYNRAELNGEIGDLSGEIINRLGGFQAYPSNYNDLRLILLSILIPYFQ
jgi:hypothetical protein